MQDHFADKDYIREKVNEIHSLKEDIRAEREAHERTKAELKRVNKSLKVQLQAARDIANKEGHRVHEEMQSLLSDAQNECTGLRINEANLKAELAKVIRERDKQYEFNTGQIAAQAKLEAELERVTAERDSFRAVVESAAAIDSDCGPTEMFYLQRAAAEALAAMRKEAGGD